MGHSRAWHRCSALAAVLSCAVAGGLPIGHAHAQVAGAPKAPPATPALSPKDCTTECHQPIAAHSVRHNQTAADCAACHVQVGDGAAHKFSLTAPKEELCIKCHQLPAESTWHQPVREGKCMECHDPHGSEHKAELRGDPNRDLCVKCHNGEFLKKSFVHGPVAVGACMACHRPHTSENPKLLLADANTLCKTCHADVGNTDAGAAQHKALEQGCIKCHDPHASNHKFQLREVAPKLCLQCHNARFDQITAGSAIVHGAITEEGGCSSCHEPHASKLPGLQRTTQPDTCLKCHDKPLKTPDGKALTNMAALLADNPEKHGPIRLGQCTACHDPHAGTKFRMLAEEYPSKFYAAFSMDLYKLCFQCHSSDLVLKPNGLGITQFRNGSKNLHVVHVNQAKGRTCRACHEVHASKRPAHIREAVPFGNSNWALEINFAKAEDGGGCAPGCHSPRKYARTGAGVINPITPPNVEPGPAAAPAGAPNAAATEPASPTPATEKGK